MEGPTKIGILTLQKQIVSYGAALQSYATWKFLKSRGYDVEIIDLSMITRFRFRLSERYKAPQQSLRKNIVHGLICDYFRHPLRVYRFGMFNRLVKYSKLYRQVDEIYANPPQYDVYITGSDQSWNPILVHNIEPYLLSFVGKDKKKISYAASIGLNDIPSEFKHLYVETLPEYKHISVRETRAKEIVEGIIGSENVSVVLDPTMLLSKEQYLEIAKPYHKKNYLLVYLLGNDIGSLRFASGIAKKNNLDLVVIGSKINGIEAVFEPNAGPREWLGLIENASYVLTNSFHGTVFSLLFGKSFNTLISDESKVSRIYTLLNDFGLMKNIIRDLNVVYDISEYQYNIEEFNNKLETFRNKSQSWLIDSIEN
ncbi:polysaccharide pyruvyl transferase family protein [Prevotella sp. KH2C16]|uniref:polysaccharide pyruvyl transferase family protein n=1 Tax=Prevotella sp. KH2C16 TaxID=1855325 RepID=UPI0008E3F4AB|nr:polysaccharide pyruvyl transferase family protein [Prevotella sp. KH2C16]SFG53325.1 Polysaccharide pyruvyl transferase [Prevotella sp. KH2C16]